MKIILVNKFLYRKGGDAIVTLDTAKLLQEKGHDVVLWGMTHPLNGELPLKDYLMSSVDYDNPGGIRQKLKIATDVLYSFEAKAKFLNVLDQEKPDIVHFNNFAHQLSPSIVHACASRRLPMIMTMHDFKLVCASYSLLANGQICELCKGGKHYHCFNKRCIKGSAVMSALGAVEMYLHHSVMKIYDLIQVFISPSEFLKYKVREFGFRGEIVHLPNFVWLDSYFQPEIETSAKQCIVYFGRLSEIKGLFTLLRAVRFMDVQLNLVGEGPIQSELEKEVESWGMQKECVIAFRGYQTGDDLKKEINNATVVVLPSECYENNPRSVIEAFALAKPVIASRIGGIPELVTDNETGLCFKPGSAEDLREKLELVLADSTYGYRLGCRGREIVEREFSSDRYYEGLMKVYERAFEKASLQ